MTALAGIWRFDGGNVADDCARMLAAQRMYGPHGTNHRVDGTCVAFGRSLFRSLPEDRFDRQPLHSANRRYLITADVRLDNREELASELALTPGSADTLSDADFLLHAWERWQDGLFDRLLGDYAFAVWDAVEHHLFLARDPFGARPLHYHRGDRFVAFASMPKGLHALKEIPYAADEDSVTELLAVMPQSGSRSFFKHIERVEPGQVVKLGRDRRQCRMHWQPVRGTLKLPSSEDYAEALRNQLDRAVAARLRGGEGNIAAHLSGGRDSGAVAATAARLLAPSGGRVVAFTAVPREGYDGRDPEGRFGNEGPVAALTAAPYPNMEHVLVPTTDQGVIDGLDRAFSLYDRPVLNPCNQRWTSAIYDAARSRRISVLLTGQMGNMTISYSGQEWLQDLARSWRWLRLLQECRALVRAGRTTWRGALSHSFRPWLTPFHKLLRRASKSTADRQGQHTALAFEREADRLRDCDLQIHDSWTVRLSVLRRSDPGNYNKGTLAGWGIDTRDPTCDRRLVEFCLSVPPEQFLSMGRPAALCMHAFADRLPYEVLDGRRKGLQAVDWHQPLTHQIGDLRSEIERLEKIAQVRAVLDVGRMSQLVENWPTNGWNDEFVVKNYRLALFRGVAGGHFLRKASRSNA